MEAMKAWSQKTLGQPVEPMADPEAPPQQFPNLSIDDLTWLTEEQREDLRAYGNDPAAAGNPPAWAQDVGTWERAKEAVEGGNYDDFYAVVTHVYKNMGGTIGS